MPRGNTLTARATINLPGLRAGRWAIVDPDDPYTKDCLDAGYLVPEGDGG